MSPLQQALFDRLMALEFDEPGVEQTFAQRLARENRWNQTFADRVVVEYKKFLLLAVTADHVVCPSEQVDQAWHQHLTYTRSYWDDLCRRVLNRPLHHSPTKGGRAELSEFMDLYQRTLATYEKTFGQIPPADIWPPAQQRFGTDARHVTINTDRYWIIPKPRWPYLPRALSRRTQFVTCGLLALPLAATWNLLDWKGPDFLGAYALIAAVAAMLALSIRTLFSQSATDTSLDQGKPLDHYEVACLAAGPARAVQAAFAAMVQAKTLEVTASDAKVLGFLIRTDREIHQGKPLPRNAPLLERTLYDSAFVPSKDLRPLVQAGLPVAKEINEDLKRRGFVNSAAPSFSSLLSAAIMAAPLFLAVPKLMIGMARGRPVAFLVIAIVVNVIAAILFLAKPRITALGNATLERLRREYASTEEMARSTRTSLPPADLAFAIGLFGAGMLAFGPLANVHAMLPRRSGGGGCSSRGGGCGTACGGGGGGGCGGGGCGGGGCGGCGGD